jgi:hypothetical protein
MSGKDTSVDEEYYRQLCDVLEKAKSGIIPSLAAPDLESRIRFIEWFLNGNMTIHIDYKSMKRSIERDMCIGKIISP